MKAKLVIFITALLSITFANTSPVLAFDPAGSVCAEHPQSSICNEVNNTGTKDPISGKNGIIAKAIRVLSYIVGVASVLMITFGGFRYVKSNGDSAKLNEARRTIIYSLVAILVVVFANTILAFVTGSIF